MSIPKISRRTRYLAASAALWLPLAAVGVVHADEPARVQEASSAPSSLAAGDALGLEVHSRQPRDREVSPAAGSHAGRAQVSEVPAAPAPDPGPERQSSLVR